MVGLLDVIPQLVTAVWVGGDERDIHFNSTALGQGSASALPVWALYMRRVYADKSLGYDPERDFDRPVSMQETTHRHAASRGGSENEESVETSTTNNEATEPVKKRKVSQRLKNILNRNVLRRHAMIVR